MIAKILFFLFRKQMIQLVFNSQRKPVDFSKLEQVFIDSNGKKYYRYIDDRDMPIVRKAYIDKCFRELGCMLHDRELQRFIEAFEVALNKKDKKNQPYIDLSFIVHLIQEIKNRKEMLIHPDIVMDLVTTVYIREDENPGEVDEDIHQQKVEQFKIDSKGGLYDFFYSAALTRYLPYSHISKREFRRLMEEAGMKTEALLEQVNQYISENESENS